MHKYLIKQNDYPLATATGKKQSVDALQRIITDILRDKAVWKNKFGVIECRVGNDVYTITKETR